MVLQYQKLENDPLYTSCNKSTCQDSVGGHCVTTTCSGSLTFRLINIRTDITFVFFTGGFLVPCVLNTSAALPFANPSSPLYGHLSSVDSTATQVCVFYVHCIVAKIEHANCGICMHVRWLISQPQKDCKLSFKLLQNLLTQVFGKLATLSLHSMSIVPLWTPLPLLGSTTHSTLCQQIEDELASQSSKT
jgi:hypothetical protein